MKVVDKHYEFNSDKERALYADLREYLILHYKNKRDLKRLVKSISWFIEQGRGDFFAGFVFDAQGTISCWGIYTGGKDADKDFEYKNFMQNFCKDLMEKKEPHENLVSFALLEAFNVIVCKMKDAGLVSVS